MRFSRFYVLRTDSDNYDWVSKLQISFIKYSYYYVTSVEFLVRFSCFYVLRTNSDNFNKTLNLLRLFHLTAHRKYLSMIEVSGTVATRGHFSVVKIFRKVITCGYFPISSLENLYIEIGIKN